MGSETKKDYAVRVENARKAYLKQAVEIESGWRKIVKRVNRRADESSKDFRERLKRLRQKHRQVAIYVGRFKQARAAHVNDVEHYQGLFQKQEAISRKKIDSAKKKLRRFYDQHHRMRRNYSGPFGSRIGLSGQRGKRSAKPSQRGQP